MVAAGIVWLIGATIAAFVFMVWLALHGLLAFIRFVNWIVYDVAVPAYRKARHARR